MLCLKLRNLSVFSISEFLIAFKCINTCSNIVLLLNIGLGLGFYGFPFPFEYSSTSISYYSISALNSSAIYIASIRSSPYLRFSAVFFDAAALSIFITLSLVNGSTYYAFAMSISWNSFSASLSICFSSLLSFSSSINTYS